MSFVLKRRFCLLGLPDDRGVGLNKGRVGAAGGPAVIRKALNALPQLPALNDGGDVPISESQLETYGEIADAVFQIHERGDFPILLGGGHDLSFGSLSGFLKKYPKGGIINIDPHLDVREPLGPDTFSSGTPFRNLMEKSGLPGSHLMEFGFTETNSEEHLRYAKEKNVRLIPFPGSFEKDIKIFAEEFSDIAVSFDLDSINESVAPGVSARNKKGYSAEAALQFIRQIKSLENLRHFELMEMNPLVDENGKTSDFAVQILEALWSGGGSNP